MTRQLAADAADAPDGDLILATLTDLGHMLLSKNAAYGNSALNPMRLFSDASTEEQLRVRIDDKLSRIRTGLDDDEDAVADLAGYLVLLMAARKGTTNE